MRLELLLKIVKLGAFKYWLEFPVTKDSQTKLKLTFYLNRKQDWWYSDFADFKIENKKHEKKFQIKYVVKTKLVFEQFRSVNFDGLFDICSTLSVYLCKFIKRNLV